jgi:catechol 2,3-dioxygenase-like lactoylglutathione lyase family enzyme
MTSKGHIGINVTDLARAEQFYCGVFGLKSVASSPERGRRYAFLADRDGLAVTLWEQSSGRFDGSAPGLHHLSFQVDSIEKVREAEQRLKELGVPFLYEGVVPHAEGAESGGIFFQDPDGVRLEIFASSGVEGTAVPVVGAPSCGFF